MNILLAVDGSAYTKKMLAYLRHPQRDVRQRQRGVAHHRAVAAAAPARAAVGAEIANGYYADEAEKVTAPVVKFLQRHGIDPKVIHKVGAPGEHIAKAANAGKFDLVMMGSHGHSALGNLVMGSVATQVLAHCKVPVLLVR